MSSVIIVLALFAWFITSPEREMELGNFTTWYDVFVNGVVVGLFMVFAGLRASEPWLKIKAIGGGAGVASCCIVSNVAAVSGAIVASSFFQFLAPVIIIVSLILGRKNQRQMLSATVV